MKRKVAKVGTLKLSPNEEALLLKQERERRRKLRLQQVREQEKAIAQQIRNDVKDRREHQLQQLAEELQMQWQAAQVEKLRALEKAYLSSLNAIGEGHRQAKENEPDLQAIQRQMAENKEKADVRHREALKELKQHKEKHLKAQTWQIKARKKALTIEKERAAKIASLPPPPPDPLENIEIVKRLPAVRLSTVDNFSVSHYHLLEPHVDREMDIEQPDARVAAEEEAKRLDALQNEEERERREQAEKANLRGIHALKMVHLTQDREKLLKELEQMQQDDLSRRRQIVAQVPRQLFEPAYRRVEIKEDWQRELESAFEDMYNGDRQVKGDMVLQLKPQPLPSNESVDEDLDLSVEPEHLSEMLRPQEGAEEESSLDEPQAVQEKVTIEPPSRLVLKKLLNKIRTQKDQWSAKSDSETYTDTLESGSLSSEERKLDVKPSTEDATENQTLAAESQDKMDNTVLAGNSILLHPQEQAMRIRITADRQKKLETIEQQKQEQLDLIKKLEEQRIILEAELLKVQHEVLESKWQETGGQIDSHLEGGNAEPTEVQLAVLEQKVLGAPVSDLNCSEDSPHIQIIREYQQRLIQQNRQHQQSVEEARKRLQEYQLLLKKRYSNLSSAPNKTAAEIQNHRDQKPSTESHPSSEETLPMHKYPLEISSTGFNIRLSQPREKLSDKILEKVSREVILPGAEHCPPLTFTQVNVFEQPDSRTQSVVPQEQSILMSSPLKNVMLPEQKLPKQESHVTVNKPFGQTGWQKGFHDNEERNLQLQTSSIGKGPVPEEMMVKLPNTFSSPDEQSSIYSEEKSISEIYHPLPSDLSLGCPQGDSLFVSKPHEILADQELHAKQNLSSPLGEISNVREFREKLLSSTAEIQVQQDHLRDMQLHLDKQRESLQSKQKIQEVLLIRRQKDLEEQMRNHQETLEKFLSGKESKQRTLPADLCLVSKTERFDLMSSMLKALEHGNQEDVSQGNVCRLRVPAREQRLKHSKPPVTKTKLGPMLEQHELSAIQEVETPMSGRRSTSGMVQHKASSPGLKNSGEEGAGYDVEISRISGSSDSSQSNFNLSRISYSSRDQSCDENQTSHRSLTWREMLSMESALHDFSNRDQSSVQHGQSSYSTNTSSGSLMNTSFQNTSARVKSSMPICPHSQNLEALYNYLSTTAPSPGSFLTRAKTDPSLINQEQHHGQASYSAETPKFILNPTVKYTSSLHVRPGMLFSPQPQSPDAFCDYLSATISTGSFLTSEKTDSSSVNSECVSDLQKCNYSIIREEADTNMSPLTAAKLLPQQIKYNDSKSPQTGLVPKEHQSQIQQIINKYTKDLSDSLERSLSFHAPVAAIDISAAEDNSLPESFHPLEAKVDFDISSPSYAQTSTKSSQDSKDFNQFSINSSSQERNSQSSSASFSHNSLQSSPALNDLQIVEPATGSKNQTPDTSSSFHPLNIEHTLNDPELSSMNQELSHYLICGSVLLNRHTPSPQNHLSFPRNLPECETSSIPPVFQASAEIIRTNQSFNEELHSFNELMATKATVNESVISEHPIHNLLEQRNEGTQFAELPVCHTEVPKHNEIFHNHKKMHCNLPQGHNSDSVYKTGAALESSNQTLKSEVFTDTSNIDSSGNQKSRSAFTVGSSAGSLSSCFLVSVSDSACGILEEPDLTLVSLNDTNTTGLGSEVIDTPASLADHHEEQSSSEGSFRALPAEVDTSVSALQCSSHVVEEFSSYLSAVMDPKFTSSPGNLQEAFLKKKRTFIENSSRRLEEIKKKDRKATTDVKLSKNYEQNNPVDQSLYLDLADPGQFKKVIEVKVCAPEDRKLTEIEMHQRTIRLYNQLDEVRTKKEEKMRLESNARNRDKAKEFKKKTLEKLRARNMK
ncbi:centrosomal protein of 295 kDa [Bombina bombina]|uniref:centrosomal protein of 295 kDa n=1 Tax=Bombina bombina TaxID=8345 RepID=UPI00235AF9D0|nr:centrosomal protein of 295 kDa [Bombina bombina]